MSEHTKAAEALGRIARMEDASRRQGGWYTRYLLVFGATQLFLVPAVLLGQGTVVAAVALCLYVVAIAGLSLYAARQRAVRRGFGLRHGLAIGTWAVVYGAAVVLGGTVFVDSVPFTVVATVCCVLPLAATVVLERRGSA